MTYTPPPEHVIPGPTSVPHPNKAPTASPPPNSLAPLTLSKRAAMNAIVQKSFDNLGESLATLVDSVASYTPSPAAALSVVAADDGLSESLDLLSEHQRNYERILSLRKMSAALDKQMTDLLEALSAARKELAAVPATVFPESHEVPYEELLAYARKISKYTLPPRFTQPQASTATNASEPSAGSGSEGGPLPLGLYEEDVTALNPASQIQFTPWPSEEVMKRGALSQMGYGEELRAQGLPVPILAPPEDGQAEMGDVGGAGGASDIRGVDPPPEQHVSASGGQGNGRPAQQLQQQQQQQQQPPTGLSLSLDLYNSDED